MDNFMDKLVEKINAQGAMRMQNMINLQEGAQGKGTRDAAHEEKLEEKIKQQHDLLVQDVAKSASAAVSEANARTTELFTEYKNQNEESLVKLKEDLADHVHKEGVKCYRNTQAVIEEKAGVQEAALKEGFQGFAGLRRLLMAAVVLLGLNFVAAVVILLRLFGLI